MRSRSHSLWLIVLLLCAAAAPVVFDATASADGWEQLDEARFEALPVTRVVVKAPVEVRGLAPERHASMPSRCAEAEIFRPPIG